ncbi:MAG: lysophospholipase L1-like esterase [Myxococcota bacterium]|jgi:lysophospholipase L1-like esterase
MQHDSLTDPALPMPLPDRSGVRHITIIGSLVGLTFAATYLHPALEDYRPWIPGDPTPLAGLFDGERSKEAPLIISQTQQQRSWQEGAIDEDIGGGLSDDELLESASATEPPNFEAAPHPRRVPPTILSALTSLSTPPTVSTSQEFLGTPAPIGRQTAIEPPRPGPIEVGGDDSEPATEPKRLEPSAWKGMTRPVELIGGKSCMDGFYRKLARVGADEPNAKARVLVYSTSTNGSDRVTQKLRRVLGDQFGTAGKGMLPIAPAWKWQKHQDVDWSARGWKVFDLTRKNRRDGRYGLLGVVGRGYRGATSRYALVDDGPGSVPLDRVDVYYRSGPAGGTLKIMIDGGEPIVVDTKSAKAADAHKRLQVDGARTVKVTVASGAATVYGVALEQERPGVVVDAAMLIGAFARRLDNFSAAHIKQAVSDRQVDLAIFYLGANDAAARSVSFRPKRFEAGYGSAIDKVMAGAPNGSCLVMSILDQGVRKRRRIVSSDRVSDVVASQKRVARAHGCAFFNLFDAIGGPGTMGRWYTARPRLVTSDLGHPTVAGARVVGLLLGKALLKGYDDWAANP